MRTVLVSILVAAAVTQTQGKAEDSFLPGIVSVGECPSITTKENFDPAAFLGAWYEIERFNVNFQAGMDCVQSVYSDLGGGVMEVHHEARTSEGTFTALGTVSVAEPGVLLIGYDGYTPDTYHVLDTDYTTFSAVYKCMQNGEVRYQYAWITSRTPTLDEETLIHARQVFATNGIDVSLFQPTHQGCDCPYLTKNVNTHSPTCSKKP